MNTNCMYVKGVHTKFVYPKKQERSHWKIQERITRNSMIIYTQANSEKDLTGILQLQRANLALNLSEDEINREGFVTVVHNFADLEKLNSIEQHIIAKENDQVIAYLLAMTQRSQFDIPVLVPMFNLFSSISFLNKPVSAYNYMVVGQVCVDKNYRGQGVFDACYNAYRQAFEGRYDFAITEIDNKNLRSLKAHQRIGFEVIHEFRNGDTDWVVVLWNWLSKSMNTK